MNPQPHQSEDNDPNSREKREDLKHRIESLENLVNSSKGQEQK